MNTPADLKNQIKSFLIEDLMLQITPQEIGDDQPLFGPGSLGLDSVDARAALAPDECSRSRA